jgi:hypothetical protein
LNVREHDECGDEREDGQDEAIGPGFESVPGGGADLICHDEAECDARDGRMDAGQVHQYPGRAAEQDEQEDHPLACPSGPVAAEPAERKDDGHREQEGQRLEVVREEEGDQQDRDQIVDDREGEQEGADPGGQPSPDEREHPQREGDVGRGRDRPTVRHARLANDQQEDDRGNDDTAHCRDARHERLAGTVQLAMSEFVAQFYRGQEEEHREEAVGHPMPDAEVEAEERYRQVRIAGRGECRPHRTVREHKTEDRRAQKQEGRVTLGPDNSFHVAAPRSVRTTPRMGVEIDHGALHRPTRLPGTPLSA